DPDYEKELRQRATVLGIGDQLELVGFQNDIVKLLDTTDILLLPSLSDAFPLVILEAMAAGRPVIATRSGGAVESVVEGEPGSLVDPGTPGRRASALPAMPRAPARRAALGDAGRRRAPSFDVKLHVANMEKVFERILEAARPPLFLRCR